VLIGIGSWASKKIHTTEDYILAGRSLGFWVFTILIICSVCSGMTLLGVSGFGYTFRLARDMGADLCAACGPRSVSSSSG